MPLDYLTRIGQLIWNPVERDALRQWERKSGATFDFSRVGRRRT
jgi:hypothetical protein